MRVLFYTHTAYLESALGLIRALSQRLELHVLLEVSPAAWRLPAFDLGAVRAPRGLVAADALLSPHFPARARRYWQDTASFHLVVHDARRFSAPSSLAVSGQALACIRRLRPDVLHFDSAPLRLGLLSPAWPTPVVIGEHDPLPHSGERNWRVDLARRLSYWRASHFILHSAWAQAAFTRRYRVPTARTSVIRFGANELMQAWRTDRVQVQQRTVLFFGRLSAYKGLDVLYAAALGICERVPGTRLIVAGPPIEGFKLPPPPPLPRGGTWEIQAGHVANARLVELCQSATLVVCPYRDATQSSVVQTAFALETPVVASAVGGLPEYVVDGETGVLVPPGDPLALEEAIVHLLQDPSWRDRLRRGIAARLNGRLGWDEAAEATAHVYQAVAGRR